MRLMTRVSTVKDYAPGTRVSYGGLFTTQRPTRMGVLPVGYADGLLRTLSGKCAFYVGGGFAPQCGRICMDMCMVDVSALPDVKPGEVATVFGRDGDAEISVDELAEKAGTISYELLCAVSPRVPRIWLG